ncbi:methyltransferase [Halomonas icarae]|uniref:Methyltransferase n=1 Tax=Halomonas icarae TaxID=2691040 RepID=A0A7X4VZQ6_9GAMM|nr:methyltransferase [Halomonas icarae]MDR5903459.1 methyltransferase [Halomonas icarae]NAW13241.1 methyltransferase [Halomonas icarae]
MSDPWSPARRLERLTELLATWRPLWHPLPFQHPGLPWSAEWSAMAEALLALSDAEAARLQETPFIDSPLADWLPVAELEALTRLPRLSAEGGVLPERWAAHMGGRKWRQVQAFLPRVRLHQGESPLEWCAGKGHLARTLARHHGVEVTALEWDATLCRNGAALADAQDAPVVLARQDVMAPSVERWLAPDSHACALHACGDLHRRLLERVVDAGCAVTLAPCCYQRTADAWYRPLSRLAADGMARFRLELSRDDLSMAVQETVTAPRHDRRHRRRAGAWRLGFDHLQREVRGIDDYLPVPSLAYGRMPATFEAFCRWAAARKGITLRGGIDWAAHEAWGQRRQREVARLELVRHLFRRPLEVWLGLDRLVFLEEAGYDAELGTFCERELTPRNLLIRARGPALKR